MGCNVDTTMKENNSPFQFLIIAFIQHFIIIMKRISPPTGQSHLGSNGEGQGDKFNSLDITKKIPCSFAYTLNLNTETIVPSKFWKKLARINVVDKYFIFGQKKDDTMFISLVLWRSLTPGQYLHVCFEKYYSNPDTTICFWKAF